MLKFWVLYIFILVLVIELLYVAHRSSHKILMLQHRNLKERRESVCKLNYKMEKKNSLLHFLPVHSNCKNRCSEGMASKYTCRYLLQMPIMTTHTCFHVWMKVFCMAAQGMIFFKMWCILNICFWQFQCKGI